MPARGRNTRTGQCRLGAGTLGQVSAGRGPEHQDRSVPARGRNTRTGQCRLGAGTLGQVSAGRGPEHQDRVELYGRGQEPGCGGPSRK